MLYEIKFLKAPWPEGAKVGDVVDMPYLPVWAVGKCNIALDGAAATIEFPEPVAADGVNRPLEGNGTGQALPTVEAINAEIAGLREKLAAADQAKDDLQMQLQGTNEAFNEMSAARAAAERTPPTSARSRPLLKLLPLM